MRTRSATLLAPLFLLVVACGGSPAQDTKTAADANGKPPECEAVGARMKAVDDRPAGKGPAEEMRSLAGALVKLAGELKNEPIETPDLRTAVDELAAEAESFGGKVQAMGGTFDEMQQITVDLGAWEKKVTATANAFDQTCETGPKAECETIGRELQTIPRLEGEKFAEHAAALETFIAAMKKLQVRDTKVKSSLSAMLGALEEGVPSMRRLSALLAEPKKLDPAAQELKTKVNRVRTICGLPPKE
ncbi:hypothetical protein [Polyangium spumosum]|uniref:Uncharacterized protein n=1 Tax=Polyangium spumosum TaxID=889282 RepID=A0A6N7PYN1_9BACT|nr:hypothetical protein [Polyangium spumosum]MRG95385.1 hypothetical protein [Polyangium spumosum]